jgi:hypothetical protein
LSGETFGAGGITVALNVGEVRVSVREISGAGGMTCVVRVFGVLLAEAFNSGEGATALIAGRVGAAIDDRRPSAGGGPGFGFSASKFATAELE